MYINLVENIARALVWEKGKWRISKNATMVESLIGFYEKEYLKIYGVGLGGIYKMPKLEIYAEPEIPKREIKKAVYNILQVEIPLEIIDCKGIRTYQSVKVGDKVKHQNLQGYGTLGGFVDDIASPYRLAISNNHVFANCNRANINDNLVKLQPNIVFGGLYRFVPLKKPPYVNEVDAAVGWIYEGLNLVWRPRKPRKSGNAYRGMKVYKYGARTGYTEGIIKGIFAAPQVDYGPPLEILNFRRCLRIEGLNGPFSLPGDSGSLVVSKSGVVVGLLLAGEVTGAYSFANPFTIVENQLGVIFT